MVVSRQEGAGIAGLGGFVAQGCLAGEGTESVEGRRVVGGTAGDRNIQIEVKCGGHILTLRRSIGGKGGYKVEGEGEGGRTDLGGVHCVIHSERHLKWFVYRSVKTDSDTTLG